MAAAGCLLRHRHAMRHPERAGRRGRQGPGRQGLPAGHRGRQHALHPRGYRHLPPLRRPLRPCQGRQRRRGGRQRPGDVAEQPEAALDPRGSGRQAQGHHARHPPELHRFRCGIQRFPTGRGQHLRLCQGCREHVGPGCGLSGPGPLLPVAQPGPCGSPARTLSRAGKSDLPREEGQEEAADTSIDIKSHKRAVGQRSHDIICHKDFPFPFFQLHTVLHSLC
mmetsp:Transcript_19807/g.55058  ORF Transcript_19807/g.55058 Transcript_19807/m.55058 type:complete len:222 (+) Transcript_19807:1599-2264(+)